MTTLFHGGSSEESSIVHSGVFDPTSLYTREAWVRRHASGGPMMMRQSRCHGPRHRADGTRSRAGCFLPADVRRNRAPMSDLRTHRCYRAHGRGFRASVRLYQNPPTPSPGGPGDGLKCPRRALVTFARSKVTTKRALAKADK